jgi:hypothetical protein
MKLTLSDAYQRSESLVRGENIGIASCFHCIQNLLCTVTAHLGFPDY